MTVLSSSVLVSSLCITSPDLILHGKAHASSVDWLSSNNHTGSRAYCHIVGVFTLKISVIRSPDTKCLYQKQSITLDGKTVINKKIDCENKKSYLVKKAESSAGKLIHLLRGRQFVNVCKFQ